MSIDKRINFRGGGAYQGGSGAPGSAESSSRKTSSGTGGSSGNLGGGGGGQDSDYRSYKAPTKPTYTSANIDQKPITGADYERGRNQFIDNLNRNNAARFQPSFFNRTYKPVTLDTVGARNQKTGLNQGLATLLGFATGIPFNLLSGGKKSLSNLNNKITNIRDKINNFQGDYRQKFTGYRTQQDYDNARQNRINLKSIDRIQNTLNRKYPDGDYSNTDLDERLADLKQSMGIVDVATVNQINDRPTQTFSFDNSGMTRSDLNNIESLVAASQVPQDLDQIGKGAGYVGYDKNELAAIAAGTKIPQLGDLTSFIDPLATITARERELKNYFDSPIQPQEGIMSYPSDLANEFQDMAIQAGNYSQNAVGNQLYGKEYDVLNPFEQQQIDKAIETYGTKSTGELASGTSSPYI